MGSLQLLDMICEDNAVEPQNSFNLRDAPAEQRAKLKSTYTWNRLNS